MIIRQAKLKEVENLRNILIERVRVALKDVYQDNYTDQIVESFYNLSRLEREISSYLVAVHEDVVVGTMSSGIFNINGEQVARLYSYNVIPSQRRKGIAKLLLNYATNNLKAKNINKQIISIPENNKSLLLFLKASGFKVVEQYDLIYSKRNIKALDLTRVV